MRVGEAVWGSGAVFELLFSDNYWYSETPRLAGRPLYRHSVFELERTLLCVTPFFLLHKP